MVQSMLYKLIVGFLLFAIKTEAAETSTLGGGTCDPFELVHYDLTREYCLNQTFYNSKTLNFTLNRNVDLTQCSQGLGIESLVPSIPHRAQRLRNKTFPHLSSGASRIRSLLRRLNSKRCGLSIELWIRPLGDNADSRPRPIMTIGRADDVQNDDDILRIFSTECESKQIDFQLTQRGETIDIMFRTTDTYFDPCPRFSFSNMPLRKGRLNHIIISLGESHQQIFINGQASPLLIEPLHNSFGHWNDLDAMHFFSYIPQSDNGTWNGRLYKIVIYDSILSSAYVHYLLALGLPSSPPYALTKTVSLCEDAKITPRSGIEGFDTESREVEMDTVPVVELSIGSVDLEVQFFLQSLNITQDIVNEFFIYITKMPLRGKLFQLNGNRLSDDDGAVIPVFNGLLVFLPFENEHSDLPGGIYASFDYCVTDHEIFEVAQCDSATISIVVDPVNDPPIAFGNTDLIIASEDPSTDDNQVLELSGRDVDDGDAIQNIHITQPPKMGYLILSVSQFRKDGLLHGTLLSAINYTVQGEVAYVEYIFDWSEKVIVQSGEVMDFFRFRVSDSAGVWSNEKTVFIQVQSRVMATPSLSTSTLEDSVSVVHLYGNDTSGLRRRIGYIIESIPPETQGRIFSSDSTVMLRPGDVLSTFEDFPYENGVNVTFEPAPDYCTNRSSLDTFLKYRVAAFVDDVLVSISTHATQKLHIQCVDDTLTMSGPLRTYQIHSFDWLHDENCSGYFYNSSDTNPEVCTSAAIITGINITCRDTHHKPAHTSISAERGRITLNRNHWDKIVPLEGNEELSSSIDFLAFPQKLNEILSYLHFQSDIAGPDAILIVVNYGNCSLTNSIADVTQPNYSHCQELSYSIPIIVMAQADLTSDSYIFGGFQWFSLPSTLLLLIIMKAKGLLGSKKKMTHEERLADGESLLEGRNKAMKENNSKSNECQRALKEASCHWTQHYDDESGHYYYHNAIDGRVTWQVPFEETFVPAKEE